jgi:hypothetical protein
VTSSSQVLSRPLPLVRRSAVRYAAGLALLGVLMGAWMYFGVFHVHERTPPRPIDGPGIGASFEAGFAGRPEMRITVTRGERQNERAAGGSRADRDNITLYLTYEALTDATYDPFAWNVEAGGQSDSGNLSIPGGHRLAAGQSATGSVFFYGIPAGAPATITYDETGDSAPRFVLEVAP